MLVMASKRLLEKSLDIFCELLDFDKKAHEIFRNWYIDGRLYYNKVIDQKNPEAGIQELRYIDASKMRYVRQVKKNPKDALNQLEGQEKSDDPSAYNFPELEEYFIYTPGNTKSGSVAASLYWW